MALFPSVDVPTSNSIEPLFGLTIDPNVDVPLETSKRPPPMASLELPPVNDTDAPIWLSAGPATNEIVPESDNVSREVPVDRITLPAGLSLVLNVFPTDIFNSPDSGLLAVRNVSDPLVVATPIPLRIITFPPVSKIESPALIE